MATDCIRSSRNGTRPYGPRPSDSGRTVFFPGRNGPARPSAAGRSRPPGHSRPFLPGRLAKCDTPPPTRTQFDRRFPILGTSCHVCPASSRDGRSVCVPCISPRTACAHTQRSTIPRYNRGTTRPAAAGAAAAAARSAAACASRACLPWYPALTGPPGGVPSSARPSPASIASALCRLRFSPAVSCRIPRSRFRSEPPSDQSGVRACPDDRRQKPQSQLLLLLTAR